MRSGPKEGSCSSASEKEEPHGSVQAGNQLQGGSPVEKDLRFTMDARLNMSQQCTLTVKHATVHCAILAGG